MWSARRAFLLAAGATAGSAALAQVDVGKPSQFRKLVSAEQLEAAAAQQYVQTVGEARAKGALMPESHPQVQRLRAMARRIIPHTPQWNSRATAWNWEINLFKSDQINAFCMPGGKIAFYTGILDTLRLNDDEAAMIMGHEMAHALREHGRERIGKTQATGMGLSALSQLLGLGDLGNVAANIGTQLLALQFSTLQVGVSLGLLGFGACLLHVCGLGRDLKLLGLLRFLLLGRVRVLHAVDEGLRQR